MKDFNYRKIWIPIDVHGEESFALNGRIGEIYKGAECMFCLGLFDSMPADESNPGEFLNHQAIVSFLLKIRSGSYAGTVLLDSSAGGDFACDPTVTELEFLRRQKAPITIKITDAMAANLTAGELYMTFTGITGESAQKDGFGRGRLNVVDIGITLAGSAPAPAEQYATVAEMRAALANKVSFGRNPPGKTMTLVSRSGAKGRTIGVDDRGGNVDRTGDL
jgi:hypothetical protein